MTLVTGSIILTGFDPDIVLDSVKLSIEEHQKGKTRQIPADYTIDNTSMRVLKLIMGTPGFQTAGTESLNT